MLALFDTRQLGGAQHEGVRTHSVSGDSRCRIDGYRSPPAPQLRVYLAPDGHYYKLVPVKGPLPGKAPEMAAGIPGQATAEVANTSINCRLDQYVSLEYQPKYVTMCGPQ